MAAAVRLVRPDAPGTLVVPDPDTVAETELPALVAYLAAVLARATARLLGPRPEPPDRLRAAEETALRLPTAVDCLWGRPDLPFRVELSPKQIRYSERGLEEWIAA